MSKHRLALVLATLAAGLTFGVSAPTAHAGASDPLSCTVSVSTTLNNTTALVYDQTFVVSPSTPYFEDFSTATRFRFFDASMAVENGVPVVSIRVDADVSVFDTIDVGASLKVRDSAGESTSGTSSFFTTSRAVRTTYTLSCVRAK